jgi:hypothetical protein
MRTRASYLLVGGSVVVGFVACSSAPPPLTGGGSNNLSGDDAGDNNAVNFGASSGGGIFVDPIADASADAPFVDSACKAGFYQGTFTGSYSSHITVVGIDIPVAGNVELTLNQQGSSNQMCTFEVEGEGITTENCSNVFTVSGGHISGTADLAFPYYCTLTGTLDCAKKVLDNGWIECTYCAIGVIPDGGGVTSTDPLANCVGAGGNFAGTLKANYDTSTLSFTDGTWNGAEALCGGIAGTSSAYCNDGGSPGPEGGPPTNYLVADGGYGLAPNYGGAGQWNASCQNCSKDQ